MKARRRDSPMVSTVAGASASAPVLAEPGVGASEEPRQLDLPGVKPVALSGEFFAKHAELPHDPQYSLAVQANQAIENHRAALPELQRRVAALGYSEADLKRALAYLDEEAVVTINVPPLMKGPDGVERSVFTGLGESGTVQNLWERGERAVNPRAPKRTKGDFLHKEHRVFAGVYNTSSPTDRPHYGALNALKLPDGGAVAYGPGVLVFKPHVKERTTYLPRDSRFTHLDQVGAKGAMAGLLVHKTDGYLRELLEVALGRKAAGTYQPDDAPSAFTGSNYLEAHIHGAIDFANDLAEVRLHRKYEGTVAATAAQALAEKFGVPFRWFDALSVPVNTDGFTFAR